MDHRYAFTDVLEGPLYRAMSTSLFGATLGPAWPADDILGCHVMLRTRWRAALTRIQSEGWLPRPTRRGGAIAIQYVRNCPPSGVGPVTRMRPCGQRLICPYCWARAYVATPYAFLADRVAAVRDAAATRSARDHVLVRHTVRRRFTVSETLSRRPPIYRQLRCLVGAAQLAAPATYRAEDVRAYADHQGAVSVFVVNPTAEYTEFARTTVVLAARDALPDPGGFNYPAAALVDRVEYPASRRGLSQALGQGCQYPAGILATPADTIRDLLWVFTGRRLLTTYPATGTRSRAAVTKTRFEE